MSVSYDDVLRIKKELNISLPLMRKDLKILPDIIDEDEVLELFILSNNKPQGVLCITNKRLVYVNSQLTVRTLGFGKTTDMKLTSIPLERLNSIRSSKAVMYGQIEVNDGAMPFLFDRLTARELDRFVKELNKQVNKAQSKTTTTGVSTADELKKFKELLDLQIITIEEFDKKKTELLK